MPKRRFLLLALLAASIVVAAAALWLYLSRLAPPPITGLLPDSPSVLYANIAPIRAATHFDQKWDLEHDPEYDAFIAQTGINPVRDLDEIAMSMQGTLRDRRYSEAIRGRFDPQRLTAWLNTHATSTESYAGKTIFTILHEGRPVRVAILSADTVGISNTNDPVNIHTILDHRAHRLNQAPAVVRANYREIPNSSLIWWIGSFGEDAQPGFDIGGNHLALGIPPDTTLIASLRYTGQIQAQVSALAPSEQAAIAFKERLQSMLKLARAVASAQSQDAGLNQLAGSISLTQSGSKVVLKADLPEKLLEDLARNSGQQPSTH